MRRLTLTALAAGLIFAVPCAAGAADTQLVCRVQMQDKGWLSSTGDTGTTTPVGDWVFDVNYEIPAVDIVSGRRDDVDNVIHIDRSSGRDLRVTDDEISFCMSREGCDVMVGGPRSEAKVSRARIDRRTGQLTMTATWNFQYTADVYGNATYFWSGPCAKKAPAPQKF